MPALSSHPAAALGGTVTVPGDKSISHRALILGALAIGETVVGGLSEGEDVAMTAIALRDLGVGVRRGDQGEWRIDGHGVGGLFEPVGPLDFGNSGTGARLMMGVIAQHAFRAYLTGDASLSSRPMGRIITPLAKMGVRIEAREGGRLPLNLQGPDHLLPIDYRLPVPSAQVKSAVLLAGLAAPGVTTVTEPVPTRDHTERLLRHFGVEVVIGENDDGDRCVSVPGHSELRAARVEVLGDPSQAAFAIVAALITPGSQVTVENVCVNPLRDGLFRTLGEMGADLDYLNERQEGGEPVADIRARFSALKGVEVPPARAASMIDEYPVLAVAAAFAEGRTEMRGLAELRLKESDRLNAMAAGLGASGVAVEELEDGMIVDGGGRPAGGSSVESHLDHRIAMSFLVLGMAAQAGVTIDDAQPIETSFPAFAQLFNGLGARIKEV